MEGKDIRTVYVKMEVVDRSEIDELEKEVTAIENRLKAIAERGIHVRPVQVKKE